MENDIQVYSASEAVRATLKARVALAEQEVRACLNYGGIYFDYDEVCSQKLILDYSSGDLVDEVTLMRRFASALNLLADSLEEQGKGGLNG